jgi:hypothetical protein
MRALLRGASLAAAAVLGLTLHLLPDVTVFVILALLLAAILLSIPRGPRRRVPHGAEKRRGPMAVFDARPEAAMRRHNTPPDV